MDYLSILQLPQSFYHWLILAITSIKYLKKYFMIDDSSEAKKYRVVLLMKEAFAKQTKTKSLYLNNTFIYKCIFN